MSKLLKESSSICILDNDVRFIECLNTFLLIFLVKHQNKKMMAQENDCL